MVHMHKREGSGNETSLDDMQSTTVQDASLPMPALIGCTGMVRRWKITCMYICMSYQTKQSYCFASATFLICVWVVIFHHSNTIHSQQIYTAIAIKSGRVMVWKAIMTVETAGLS